MSLGASNDGIDLEMVLDCWCPLCGPLMVPREDQSMLGAESRALLFFLDMVNAHPVDQFIGQCLTSSLDDVSMFD